ncbi:hypothetical protein PMI05_04734 [Brevibacillus sp. BC25]|nr:hypothetical protein PMI05_04734 [Brevibacillus sp. BC25]
MFCMASTKNHHKKTKRTMGTKRINNQNELITRQHATIGGHQHA